MNSELQQCIWFPLLLSQQPNICAVAIAFGARKENAREEMKLHHAAGDILYATPAPMAGLEGRK